MLQLLPYRWKEIGRFRVCGSIDHQWNIVATKMTPLAKWSNLENQQSPLAKDGSIGWKQGCSWFSRLLHLARGVICVAKLFHWWSSDLQTQNLPISFHLYGSTWSTSDWAFLLNSPNDFRCLRNVDILIEMPSSLVRNINISQCLNLSKK